MKKLISTLVVLALAALGTTASVSAQGLEETAIQFRSLHDPSIPDPDPLLFCMSDEVLDRLPADADLTNMVPVPLGASLWSLATQAKDGKVINEKIKQVGTGDACAYIDFGSLLDPKLIFPKSPFYGEFVIGGQEVTTSGYCTRTGILYTDLGPVILVGCSMDVLPECSSEGIVGGLATSSSIFNPFGVPGFSTGSLWGVRLFSEE